MNNNNDQSSQPLSSSESPYLFETRMEVRDYECDIEGIVNNANYLHYIEHTRHLFLRSLGHLLPICTNKASTRWWQE